jgi:hypothetical protein
VDVLEICAAADFPACLMMRRMLEHMLGLSKQVRARRGGGGEAFQDSRWLH